MNMADGKGGLKDWLKTEGFPKYEEATRLSTEDSKNDPETEPYKSKYAAREILIDLLKSVEHFTSRPSNSEKLQNKLRALKCTVQYDLALNYIETDEKVEGERYLNEMRVKLQDVRVDPHFCSLVIKCCQQLGILWNERGDFQKGFDFFSEAEMLYNDYKGTECGVPYESMQHFQTAEDDSQSTDQTSNFESLHTYTLYYISQAYKNLGETTKSAKYCHNTLKRQLLTKIYDPADWAVNCATLSQYHLTQGDYKAARHSLACASVILDECQLPELEKPTDLDTEGEDERKAREHIPQAKANVALCWSKYCIYLLTNSAQIINGSIEDSKVSDKHEDVVLKFDSLDVSKLENEVPCEIVNNYDEARTLFLAGQRHLNIAKEFYELDGYVTNHVEIMQDHSELYKQLTFFDLDVERQCKMCKRRVDMLTPVLSELNPQHYLVICQQLIFEIASIYSDMADLKTCIVAESESKKATPHQVKKINSLLGSSERFYTSFLDSLKQEGELPQKYEQSVLRVALLAHLCLARIYSKKLPPGTEQRIENYKKSLEFYQYIVDYCEQDEDGANSFGEELQACKEMVDLLPYRLTKMREEMN